MSVLNNFSVSIARGIRRIHKPKELESIMPRTTSRRGSTTSKDEKPKLKMEKCLIVSKVTRYEYEKYSRENITDKELERIIRKRGSDFEAMKQTHSEQKAFEEGVARSLREMGLQVEMASRLTYNEELINWCDVVVPCGGDGTFLLAASRVRDHNKPVIGFNSAPHKSVGRLCLPTWCSNDVKGALHALKEGRFRWMRRTRIRTTVSSVPKLLDKITPVDLHTLHYCRYPPVSNRHDDPEEECCCPAPPTPESSKSTKVLPFLALNEVFIGESVTSRVSLLRLQIDNGQWTHTKSSGLCVTTGTGSTSWHFSINCLRTHSVLELMKILSEDYNVKLDTTLEKAREVAERYNQKLMFAADSQHLAYSVREYITFEEWPAPRGLRVRDKATSIKVKSHCTDAGLVIDGSVSFPFNDGTEAVLEVHPEDSLMTVQMDDALPH
ncbi:NAD kinase 2, mitochondrial [Amyelois transitella]|uniref:NAD kinase 2, mitochondrial n=1 Tax=Amyelois transitella TaxID=680683 RepID=UPI00067B86B9|nr:NAD kinase 2, mitochondrial [Amyelois transitella]